MESFSAARLTSLDPKDSASFYKQMRVRNYACLEGYNVAKIGPRQISGQRKLRVFINLSYI
jgi:hypothetical protein